VDPSDPHERFKQAQAEHGDDLSPAQGSVAEWLHLPRGDHQARAEELVAHVTAQPTRNLEVAAQAAVAEAALAVADELAKLRRLLTERLPAPPPLQRPAPGRSPAGVVDLAAEMRAMGLM
jgi:hypothetical protein